jgi:hypothetical protein
MATPARALTTRRRGVNDDRRIANSPFGGNMNQGAGGHNGNVPVELRGTEESDGSVPRVGGGTELSPVQAPSQVEGLGGSFAQSLLRRRNSINNLGKKKQNLPRTAIYRA